MKKFVLTLVFSVLVVFPANFSHAQVAGSSVKEFTILHTNDMHAHTKPNDKGVGGFPSLSNYIHTFKAENENVLVLDAGDTITGSPVSTLFEGAPIFDILNTIPYDLGVLGNHEFDHGWDKIEGFLATSKHPLLCCNVRTPDGKLLGDAPVQYITVNGVKIGIIGVLLTDLYRVTGKNAHEGLVVTDAIKAVGEYLPEVDKNSDLVLVLSHCGVSEDEQIANAYDNIDIIIGGHSHTRLFQPQNINNTIIVQAGSYTQFVGKLEIEFDTDKKKIVTYKGELVTIESEKFPPHEATQKIVDKWEKKVSELVDIKIGENSTAKSAKDLAPIIGEIMKARYGTDYGYQNDGGTRASLPEGDILKRNIWNMLPFGNKMVVLKVKGNVIQKTFLQDPPNGEETYYTVATNDFAGDKAIDRYEIPEENVIRHSELLRDIVIEYIEQNKNMEAPDFEGATE